MEVYTLTSHHAGTALHHGIFATLAAAERWVQETDSGFQGTAYPGATVFRAPGRLLYYLAIRETVQE